VAAVTKWLAGAQPYAKPVSAWQTETKTYTACIQDKYGTLQRVLTGDQVVLAPPGSEGLAKTKPSPAGR
jgi:hypothetical protein